MNKKPTKGISVDAGTQGNPGVCFYRVVDIENGIQLEEKNLGEGTNNLAEFIGLVNAIKNHGKSIMDERVNIYTDSNTALAWLRNKKVNTSYSGPILLEVAKCIAYLNSDSYELGRRKINVEKWNTKEWGEIPADFGRKSGGKSVPVPTLEKQEQEFPITKFLLEGKYTLTDEAKKEIAFLLAFYNNNK